MSSTLEDIEAGGRFEVRSAYVSGADGGQSAVEEAIKLSFTGTRGIAPALNVVFRSDPRSTARIAQA